MSYVIKAASAIVGLQSTSSFTRMRLTPFSLVLASALVSPQTAAGPDVAPFITVTAPVFALTHVRVIDGSGAPAKEDQTIVIENGKIQSVGPAPSAQVPTGA